MLVISLTSIPPRFAGLASTLDSLLAQGLADVIALNIPHSYARFPDWDGALPPVPAGISLHRCDDLGPASKVLPTCARYRGTGARIFYCDDDATYGPGWAAALLAGHEPGTARAATGFAARRIGAGAPEPPQTTCDIAQGADGVLVGEEMFPDSAFDIPVECRLADDIWLSAQLAASGVPIHLCPGAATCVQHGPTDDFALQRLDRAAVYARALARVRRDLDVWNG